MRAAVVPASLLAKPPPFSHKTHTSWDPRDWCGSPRAVIDAEAAVKRARVQLANAEARLEAATARHASAVTAAAAIGYAIISNEVPDAAPTRGPTNRS